MSEGEFHEVLMAYGKVCNEDGYLSERAVTIRMDLATHYNMMMAENRALTKTDEETE